MSLCFCDTSTIVKYYVTEPGSQWVWQLIDSGEPVFLVEITVAEVSAALGIMQRIGRISKRHRIQCWERFEKDCVRRYQLLPTHYRMIRTAALLCINHPLKGYDAVQVAAALLLQQALGPERPLTFVAGDKNVIAAAQAEGLAVDNPFWHIAENETSATPH